MKLNIVRELRTKNGGVEVLLEVDKELTERYQSETGDYSDPPDQAEFNDWFNTLVYYALEGADPREDDENNWFNDNDSTSEYGGV